MFSIEKKTNKPGITKEIVQQKQNFINSPSYYFKTTNLVNLWNTKWSLMNERLCMVIHKISKYTIPIVAFVHILLLEGHCVLKAVINWEHNAYQGAEKVGRAVTALSGQSQPRIYFLFFILTASITRSMRKDWPAGW